MDRNKILHNVVKMKDFYTGGLGAFEVNSVAA